MIVVFHLFPKLLVNLGDCSDADQAVRLDSMPHPQNGSEDCDPQSVLCDVMILSPKFGAEICFPASVISQDDLTGREIYTALCQGFCQENRADSKWHISSTGKEHKYVPEVNYIVVPHLAHVCRETVLQTWH